MTRTRALIETTLGAMLVVGLCLAGSWLALRLTPARVFWHEESAGWAWRSASGVVLLALPALRPRWRWPLALLVGASLSQACAYWIWGAVPDYLSHGDRVLDLADLALGTGFLALAVALGRDLYAWARPSSV